MEKIFEKIADHFNNPEMADRILCVKVREDGWEKLEAASLLRHIRSKTKPSDADNNDAGTKICSESEGLCYNYVDITGPRCSVSLSGLGETKTEENENCENERLGTGIGSIDQGQRLKEDLKPKLAKSKKQESFSSTTHETFDERNKEVQFENDQLVKSNPIPSEKEKEKETGSVHDKSETVLCDKEMTTSSLMSKDNATEDMPPRESHDSMTSSDHDELLEGVLVGSKDEDDLSSTVIKKYEIHVHSFWLSLNSSFFRSLFYSSGMRETKDKQV